MNNSTVCHNFVYGRDSKGSNITASSDILRSYSSVLAKKFGDIILVSRYIKGYSNTSAKHWNHLNRAIPSNFKVIFVEDICPTKTLAGNLDEDNLLEEYGRLKEFIAKHRNARTSDYSSYISDSIETIKLYQYYNVDIENSETFKEINSKGYLEDTFIENIIKDSNDRRKLKLIADEKRKLKELERKKESLIKNAMNYGVDVNLYTLQELERYRFIKIIDDKIRTSGGVSVKLDIALKAYKAIKNGINLVGTKVDVYQIREISEDSVTIGCHIIPMRELDRVLGEIQ